MAYHKGGCMKETLIVPFMIYRRQSCHNRRKATPNPVSSQLNAATILTAPQHNARNVVNNLEKLMWTQYLIPPRHLLQAAQVFALPIKPFLVLHNRLMVILYTAKINHLAP